MNIAIVQIYDDNIKEYAEYSRLMNAMYAHKHNYTYIAIEYDLVPVSMSVYYNKILAIMSALKDSRKFEYVLYLDSDAIITNFDYTIESIIERHLDKDIIIASDENGTNNGVLLFKNTAKSLEFLQRSFSNRSFFHTDTPEQNAMLFYLQNEYRKNTGLEKPSFFNAYLDGYKDQKGKSQVWNEQSFILHLMCLSTKDRCAVMREKLAKMGIVCIPKPADGPKAMPVKKI